MTSTVAPSVGGPEFSSLIQDTFILDALKVLNISRATPVQAAALPEAIAGRDLVVQAQTGSGKTLAFLLPLLTMLRTVTSRRDTVVLIITPTRELASQVKGVISAVCPDITAACLIGGGNPRAQLRDLDNDARIVVGTPGRLSDFLERRELSLRSCKAFVLDEADEMLSMGFAEDVRAIVSRIPRPRQGLFFSATITPRVEGLALTYLTNFKKIVIETSIENTPKIEHLFCNVDAGLTSKAAALTALIEVRNPSSAIVFCNTKSDTELVEVFLRRRGFGAQRINSDLSQKEREKIMNQLRAGELRLLIATDVAARGIDIESLDLVVNYAIHEEPETYVHRTGRTGRAGRSGTAISIVGPQDFGPFYNLRKKLTIDLQEIKVPTEAEVAAAREPKLQAARA